MKTRYIKQLFSAALTTVLSLGVTSCINDLDISPIDPQTGGSFCLLYTSDAADE